MYTTFKGGNFVIQCVINVNFNPKNSAFILFIYVSFLVYLAAQSKARASHIFDKKFTQKIGNARRREKRCGLTSFKMMDA